MLHPKKNDSIFMIALLSGTLLNPLNSSMIALALHSIQQDYHLNFSTVSWLVSVFYLVSAISQPVAGKAGDLIGRKSLFIAGLLLSAIACFYAPLAPFFAVLLLMRVLQAVGNGTLYPSGVALIHQSIARSRQDSALASLAICASVMSAFGPTIGGFLIVWGGWRSIFYVNYPLIFISLLLALFIFPKDVKSKDFRLRNLVRQLDLPGIFLFSVSILGLLWFLLKLSEKVSWPAIVMAIAASVFFVRRESHTHAPFIDIHLLKSHYRLSLVYLLFILLNIINYCLFYGMPSFFQGAMHLGIRESGLMMLCMSLAGAAVSLMTGQWISRFGPVLPLKTGSLFTVAGALMMTIMAFNHSLLLIGFILLLIGCGYGIGTVALQAMMLREAPETAIGTSAGLFQTCRFLGSIGAAAILGVVFAATITSTDLLILIFILAAVSVPAFLISLIFFPSNR
ncbi:MFS transporter [Sporolactobacillus sp. CPB3-1]|uniref:MFS transporter n=1 Tax=Sporolactobacillus mangiferae TaxID=2940498 RepID=A0ABT0M9U1_9BACL|nr:MFS transporter [Sporolactobacillus mangiferae]MCL1631629.1 MFS transporter [Sporolactobacillus mangiferae]